MEVTPTNTEESETDGALQRSLQDGRGLIGHTGKNLHTGKSSTIAR